MNRTATPCLEPPWDVGRICNATFPNVSERFSKAKLELGALGLGEVVDRDEIDIAIGQIRGLIELDSTVLDAGL